jgi:hypothetical protein
MDLEYEELLGNFWSVSNIWRLFSLLPTTLRREYILISCIWIVVGFEHSFNPICFVTRHRWTLLMIVVYVLHTLGNLPVWAWNTENMNDDGKWSKLRAALDKGPGIRSPGTSLEANWTLNWILFHINFLSPLGAMSVSKGLGSNPRVRYKKCVIDMWEDKDSFWSSFFLYFLFLFYHG